MSIKSVTDKIATGAELAGVQLTEHASGHVKGINVQNIQLSQAAPTGLTQAFAQKATNISGSATDPGVNYN